MSTANALELSDEEFLKQPMSAFEGGQDTADTSSQPDEAEQSSNDPEEDHSEAQEQPGLDQDDDEVSQPDGDTQTAHELSSERADAESLDTSKSTTSDTKGDTPETKPVDYESAYKRITAPFKANGVEMQISSPDDIIKLMQMGANYQKKMATLKPNLKLIKMLENNGISGEAQLTNLIDISKRNPAALAKLFKDGGIDPLDIDTDKAAEYTPGNYGVTDQQFDLDAVLESIKDSPTFNRTIDTISKQWDDESKRAISESPEIVEIINTHMQNGVYDQVNALLERERALGNLKGVPVVTAYRQAAEYLTQRGQLINPQRVSPVNVSSGSVSPVDAADRAQKRKAAAPTKKTASTKTESLDDYLGLSDDEFIKRYSVR